MGSVIRATHSPGRDKRRALRLNAHPKSAAGIPPHVPARCTCATLPPGVPTSLGPSDPQQGLPEKQPMKKEPLRVCFTDEGMSCLGSPS